VVVAQESCVGEGGGGFLADKKCPFVLSAPQEEFVAKATGPPHWLKFDELTSSKPNWTGLTSVGMTGVPRFYGSQFPWPTALRPTYKCFKIVSQCQWLSSSLNI